MNREVNESLDGGTVKEQLREFARRRDWEQYHDPKNLSIALAVEVGELLEHFQWLTPGEALSVKADATKQDAIADELADVAIYLLRLSDVLEIDLGRAIDAKIARNEERFPPVR